MSRLNNLDLKYLGEQMIKELVEIKETIKYKHETQRYWKELIYERLLHYEPDCEQNDLYNITSRNGMRLINDYDLRAIFNYILKKNRFIACEYTTYRNLKQYKFVCSFVPPPITGSGCQYHGDFVEVPLEINDTDFPPL